MAVNRPEPVVVGRRTLHKGKKFDYEELTVRSPAGSTHARQLVRHPGACVVVPVMPDGRVALIRCFRVSFEKHLWECPAGTLEPGEAPVKTAERELIEETGLRLGPGGTLVPLSVFYTSPGLSDEVMHAFAATGLVEGEQELEDYEHITVHKTEPGEVRGMIDRGEIADSKSMLALLLAARRGLFKL
jgi:ADP-ribose pyrophosphatase